LRRLLSGITGKKMPLLKHSVDTYKSALINDPILQGKAPVDPLEFESSLFETLNDLKTKGIRGVWLKLLPTQADLVAPAIRCGFDYHSVTQKALTLTAWLPKDEENKLPPAASHFVGVGCFLLNSKNEILVVREKTGPSARLADFWKLPGGLCDRQEDIPNAAVRELREETAIESEFVSISSIQEIHHSEERAGPARTGTTDLYAICILKAKDENQKVVACETEIAEAKWMPADQVLSLPFYAAKGSIFSHMFHHAYKVAKNEAPGMGVIRLKLGFVNADNNLFGVFSDSKM